MTPEDRQLLEENIRLSKENNDMLQKLIVFKKWSQVYRIVYWSIIILSAIGAFYFIKPFVSNLLGVYSGALDVSKFGNISEITKNLGNNNDLKDLFNSLNN